jgi:hypothetical protein
LTLSALRFVDRGESIELLVRVVGFKAATAKVMISQSQSNDLPLFVAGMVAARMKSGGRQAARETQSRKTFDAWG